MKKGDLKMKLLQMFMLNKSSEVYFLMEMKIDKHYKMNGSYVLIKLFKCYCFNFGTDFLKAVKNWMM